jgi:hypothetical protein
MTSEKNVGYRGSKSVILNNITVKEQRGYGSTHGNILPCLSCTLTGFVKNYQIKNHSNQIIQRRLYFNRYEADNNLTVYNKHTQLNEP